MNPGASESVRRRSDASAMFDDDLLGAFMDTFYGYGSLSAPIWYVGMEESGGDFAEIQRRLGTWDARGRRRLEDCAEYHVALGIDRNFRASRPVIQRTWRGLILINLAFEGRALDREAVREYQRTEWGRTTGRVALLELLPLPSPSISHWIYGDHSARDELRSRAAYEAAVAPRRIDVLRKLVREHRPTAVIFYGSKYLQYWEQVVGAQLLPTSTEKVRAVKGDGTRFISIPHPVAHGLSDVFFTSIGEGLRGRLT